MVSNEELLAAIKKQRADLKKDKLDAKKNMDKIQLAE